MKEYLFYIRNAKDAKLLLTEAEHLEFIKKCESYIGRLKKENRLIAAQPIVREGRVIRKSDSGWTERDIQADAEIQVGYYHVRASNMEEAVAMAKENPEFEYVPSASIEVRPVKTKEAETGFVYPTQE